MVAAVVLWLQAKSIITRVYMWANEYYNLIDGNHREKQNTMRKDNHEIYYNGQWSIWRY